MKNTIMKMSKWNKDNFVNVLEKKNTNPNTTPVIIYING